MRGEKETKRERGEGGGGKRKGQEEKKKNNKKKKNLFNKKFNES